MPNIITYSLTKALYYYFLPELTDFTNNPDDVMNLSEMFAAARVSRNMTQQELADDIGTMVATLIEVEEGDLMTSFNELKTYF